MAKYGASQMPKIVCNFTDQRKLHLLPGVEITNNRQMFADVPNQVVAGIEPRPGNLMYLYKLLVV